ncbi:MAG: uracil-DNA glycosylase [Gammaproteobacteria bacterium]|nr:MAG: uracil-DNA glycosylase [Gammaproteobacteria bacterium]
MDNTTRLQYLSAMGIDVWVPRASEGNVATQDIAPDAKEDSWEILQAEMLVCQQCDLCQSRQQVVVGAGNRQADFLWVTEAPGLEDEQQGMPFADHSGELLTEMLRAMSLSREDIFITHIVKCRPAEDRDPKKQELIACGNYLQRQIALIQPKIIIALGRVAAHKLLQSKAPLAELRETEHEFSGIPLQTIYHPAYLLRSLTEKSKAWQDMQRALTLFEKVK